MTNAPSQSSVSSELYRAAARAWPKSVVVATHGRQSSERKAMRQPHPVVAAIGAPLHEERAVALVGVHSGTRRYLGACVHQGQRVVFDFWFPHLGIAVDVEDGSGAADALRPWSRVGRGGHGAATAPRVTQRMDEGELATKATWCKANGVVYVAPEDARDLETLKELAARRRGECADG